MDKKCGEGCETGQLECLIGSNDTTPALTIARCQAAGLTRLNAAKGAETEDLGFEHPGPGHAQSWYCGSCWNYLSLYSAFQAS